MVTGYGLRYRSWCLAGVALLLVAAALGCSASGKKDSTTSTTLAPSTEAPTTAPTTSSTTTSTTAPATTTTVPATTTAAPNVVTVPPSVGPRDVRTEPAGLFCRDLKARGYSYSAAVDYWRSHGQPDQMDADRNGIPCETVFPRPDVTSYWGFQPTTPPTGGLRSGLLCKDLYAAGVSYPAAVAYWYFEGVPARMDIDGNGIPCETVYPASTVNSFWYG